MASKSLHYLRDFSLIVISSILLVLSFPSFDLGFLAWVGLLPLVIVIHGKSLKYGFILSLICGILFFLGVFYWILAIPGYTLIHPAILAGYLVFGLYFGVFGLLFAFICNRLGPIQSLYLAPFLWVSLEYVRSNLSFLALPWGLLAHSQYQYPIIIQIASLGGTYSISFLIVMVNAAFAALVLSFQKKLQLQRKSYSKIHPDLPLPKEGVITPPLEKGDGGGFQGSKVRKIMMATTAFLMILTLLYGYFTISKPIIGDRVKISLVQGNIPQERKWDRKYAREIMQTYAELTDEASKDQPALIVWPETATPGAITLNPRLYIELTDIVTKAGTYLLLGSAQHQKFEEKGAKTFKYLNSAYLLYPESRTTKKQQYIKIRLFPFGEYLPYKDIIPWSLINVRDSGDYLAGNQFTVFRHPDFRFGVTICWEDVFPDLVRQFVRRGAQCIINLTNEAHFGKTAAPHQLVSISVFRAVENRVFVVRCANTGVSCIIDPYGRIVDRVKDEKGRDIFVRGVMSGWIIPLNSKTIYTRYGDWFVWVAFIGMFVILTLVMLNGRKRKHP